MADDNKSFPFESRQISTEELKEKEEFFTIVCNITDTRFGPKGYLSTKEFEQVGRDIYNMELRRDDIFVTTFPKCGTTWTQELVWLIANNFDFESAREISLSVRYPFIETVKMSRRNNSGRKKNLKGDDQSYIIMDRLDALLGKDLLNAIRNDKSIEQATNAEKFTVVNTEMVASMPSPRFLKSHLPISLLPPKLLDTCKVIYVAREARDVAVSYFHHSRLTRSYKKDKDFKSFWKFFKRGLVDYAPFFQHVKEAWELRDHPNMLFLFYEELSKDLPTCARRVAKFLDKDMTDEQLDQLCDFLYIDNFRKNKSVNLSKLKELGMLNPKEDFIRKGKVGGWREYFDEEMTREAEEWIEENLRDTDFRFPQ